MTGMRERKSSTFFLKCSTTGQLFVCGVGWRGVVECGVVNCGVGWRGVGWHGVGWRGVV